MSKIYNVSDLKETILAYSQGQSLGQISRLTGIPKTTVKRFVDQAGATGMSVEAILTMPDEDVTKLLTPSRRARLNYDEPDWEMVYLRANGECVKFCVQ